MQLVISWIGGGVLGRFADGRSSPAHEFSDLHVLRDSKTLYAPERLSDGNAFPPRRVRHDQCARYRCHSQRRKAESMVNRWPGGASLWPWNPCHNLQLPHPTTPALGFWRLSWTYSHFYRASNMTNVFHDSGFYVYDKVCQQNLQGNPKFQRCTHQHIGLTAVLSSWEKRCWRIFVTAPRFHRRSKRHWLTSSDGKKDGPGLSSHPHSISAGMTDFLDG